MNARTERERDIHEPHGSQHWRSKLARYLLLGAIGSSACANATMDEPLAEVAGLEQALWTKNGTPYFSSGHIPVCFQPRISPFDMNDERGTANYVLQTDRIRSVVEAAFEDIPGADIDFTGFADCPGASVPARDSTNMGQAFSGQKFMIQSNGPAGQLSREGWQTGYPAQGSSYSWTSQSYYAWGDQWDSVVEHETMHALGFTHEFDRFDFDTPCPGGGAAVGSHAADTGTRLTRYDHESALNDSYCGDWLTGLSSLDRLGLAMVYPDGSAIAVKSSTGFDTAAGLVVSTNSTVAIDWTVRGATASVFAASPGWSWQRTGQAFVALPSGVTQPASRLTGGTGQLKGSFTDWKARAKTIATTSVQVNDSLHAGLAQSSLISGW